MDTARRIEIGNRLWVALAWAVAIQGIAAQAQDFNAQEATWEADTLAVREDSQFQLAQATERRENTSRPSNNSGRGRASRAPYMIGDSPYGPLAGNYAVEGVDLGAIDHPIFDGHRFNVAEANAVAPDDRFLFSYRHFHNVSSNNVLGTTSTVDVERFLVGIEKSLLDGMISVDFRVPLLRELNSDLVIFDDGIGGTNLPVADRHGTLGNLATTIKLLLTSRDNFAVSTGVAVNAPTAEDARISQDYLDPLIAIGDGSLAGTDDGTDFLIDGRFENNIVNLTPFVAWSVVPRAGFFHQGFLQVDVPLNRGNAQIDAAGNIEPDGVYGAETFAISQTGKYEQQTLLRLNLSMGYWLYRGNRNDLVRGIAGMFEAHYTTALTDADPFVAELTTLTDGINPANDVPVNVVAGSSRNSFDQVNLAAGCAVDLGGMLVTNGFIFPVTDGPDRSFDFEYNLQVNKRF
jgi:hypothetical protein